ncbi:hypothetical protein BH11MYX1_BH11MYX1_23800 [soil metagenome]
MHGVVRVSHLLTRGLLACAVAAGCGNNAGSGPDAAVVGDGSNTSAGLSVHWATEPGVIPGDAGSDITISSLLFRVANLRVIGDAGPGDTRTSVDSIELAWSAGMVPAVVSFSDAPTGLYSRVILHAESNLGAYTYEIAGTVKLDNVVTPFTIHDRSPLAVNFETSAPLDPGASASLLVHVRIARALQSLDFHQLTRVDNVLVLDTLDNAMHDFHDQMMSNVFESHDD